MSTQRHRLCRIFFALCCLAPGFAWAQGFSALVSPPRIEDNAKAGETYRDVIEITNVSDKAAHYTVKTADWTLQSDNTVQFSEALAPGSCRPWVGVEAGELNMGPNAKKRYRFEVAVPADAPSGECRFAIMIESDPENVAGGVAIPVSGRIGVIVYLTLGDAAPQLSIAGQKLQTIDGQLVPVLLVRNAGNAHARLQGFVDGKDGSGKTYAFAPSTLPILPGETRDIPLTPQGDSENAPPPAPAYPVQLKGRLDWGKQHLDIETTLSR
ncbi:MAG TPA: hypothetical protein VF471_09820 [Pseudoxanthomonas sp.]